jgi:hypothetical protein
VLPKIAATASLELLAGSGSVALRLADFGGCFSLTETDTQSVGCEVQTLPYRAPEVGRACGCFLFCCCLLQFCWLLCCHLLL